ncbi:GPR1/FUN34/YaaH family transporter [Kitasatospora sp. NPDC056138]|uniref:GPR1/FUN34/YaaH family transporter n=1 Tax=Kitasatospora sp. NPDC056138 TaxID=3345724 RepID=UPI0035E20CF1
MAGSPPPGDRNEDRPPAAGVPRSTPLPPDRLHPGAAPSPVPGPPFPRAPLQRARAARASPREQTAPELRPPPRVPVHPDRTTATRTNGAVLGVFVTLTPTFLFPTIGAFTQSTTRTRIGDRVGPVTALGAWCASFAMVTDNTRKRTVLPVRPLDRTLRRPRTGARPSRCRPARTATGSGNSTRLHGRRRMASGHGATGPPCIRMARSRPWTVDVGVPKAPPRCKCRPPRLRDGRSGARGHPCTSTYSAVSPCGSVRSPSAFR